MASINDKYKRFHQALILSPEYMGIANKDRKACKEFVDLATKLDKPSPPDPDDVEAAFVAATNEARMLVTQGVLTVELPDEKQKNGSNTNTEASTSPASHQKYEIHPAAAIFPMMSDEALDELAADIKDHGLRDPVVMHNGKLLDGRNRLEACHRAGVKPTLTEWTGSGSVVTWILSVNFHRRHLSDQQRAMIAARVAQELTAESKERSARNLSKSGEPVDGTNLTHRGEGRSTEQAASLLNVSPSAAKKATKIAKSATEELVKAVTDGTVSLDAAAQVANLPKAKQRTLVEKGKVQEAAKKIRGEKAAAKTKAKESTEPEPANPQPQASEAPPAPDNKEEPAADTEPPETTPKEAEENEGTEAPASSTPDEFPLLHEAHDGLDKMVSAARYAGRLESVSKQLRAIAAHCQKMKVQYEEAAMP